MSLSSSYPNLLAIVTITQNTPPRFFALKVTFVFFIIWHKPFSIMNFASLTANALLTKNRISLNLGYTICMTAWRLKRWLLGLDVPLWCSVCPQKRPSSRHLTVLPQWIGLFRTPCVEMPRCTGSMFWIGSCPIGLWTKSPSPLRLSCLPTP